MDVVGRAGQAAQHRVGHDHVGAEGDQAQIIGGGCGRLIQFIAAADALNSGVRGGIPENPGQARQFVGVGQQQNVLHVGPPFRVQPAPGANRRSAT